MKNLNILVRSLLMIGLSLSMMACDKKKDSKPNFADRYNRQQYTDRNGNILPGGSSPFASQQCPNCGYITNNQYPDMSGLLSEFLLVGPGELAGVSGQSNGNTGVLFRGDVDPSGRSGYVEIIIWDDIANQTGQAYVVRMDVDPNANNYVDDNYGASITFADGAGTVTFDGQWYQDGTYQGQVSYSNNGQGAGTLGNFIVGNRSFIR